MRCDKCSSKMYRTSLNYETNGSDNFSIFEDVVFFKCPICGHQHFGKCRVSKRIFISGQKIKGVPVDVG